MKSADDGYRLDFLYADNHLLAVNKPAGLPAQPDESGDEALIDLAKAWVRRKGNKPGDVYLALLHRLDRPTSGVVLLARTSKAAGRMADLFRRREIEKRYLALVECRAEPDAEGRLENFLAPNPGGGMRVVAGREAGAREARLAYRTLAAGGGRALLEILLETGVKHQIRCQLAKIGLPVVGDFRYGAFGRVARPEPVAGGRAILLHAWRAAFVHPVRREPVAIAAPHPEFWRDFLSPLPGAARLLATGTESP